MDGRQVSLSLFSVGRNCATRQSKPDFELAKVMLSSLTLFVS